MCGKKHVQYTGFLLNSLALGSQPCSSGCCELAGCAVLGEVGKMNPMGCRQQKELRNY